MNIIQELGNNAKSIIRLIDREEAKTYRVQLDRESLARIKEKIDVLKTFISHRKAVKNISHRSSLVLIFNW